MTHKKYFEKTGKIYGIGERFEFGKWNGYRVEFDDWTEANEWHEEPDALGLRHIKYFATKTAARRRKYYTYINSNGSIVNQGYNLQI